MAELSKEPDMNEHRQVHRTRSGLWFGIFILLIVFVITGAGFYLLQQLRTQQTDLGGEVNKGDMQLIELSKQISGYQSQLAALANDIAGKDAHFTKTLADFSALHNEKLNSTQQQLNEAIQQIQRQLGKTRGDWLIADAEYLLIVANERLHLIGDLNTTREALEAADQRLRESGDAGVFKVREEIVKELSLLKTVNVPDVVGMYSSIQNIQTQVDKLTLLLPFAGKTAKPEVENKNQDEAGPLDKLKGLVTIRHTEHAVEKILTVEEAAFILEQLKVKLEMVKIALVQHNEVLFESSLLDTKNWISQHFINNSVASTIQEELDRLATIKINSHFPDISSSLKMLRDVSKLRIETDKALQNTEPLKPVEKSTSTAPITPATTEKPVEANP